MPPFNAPGGFSNKKYSPGEKMPYHLRPTNLINQYYYLKVGRIESVDAANLKMTVNWALTKRDGVRDEIPISFAHAGPAGYTGSLPAKGAIGIFGFFDEGDGKGSPLLLSYLPSGVEAGANHDVVRIEPTATAKGFQQGDSGEVNDIKFKFRKLTIGDTVMSSPEGASIFLNKSVELKNETQDSIVLREDDQTIISTSLNNFVFADGVSVNIGPALRNKLHVYDSQGEKNPNNGSIVTLSSGKDNIYIVPQGAPISATTQYYTEYRIDVDEFGNGQLDLNDINSSSPVSDRDPIISMSLGNFIGADVVDKQKYGSILKARVFANANDTQGGFALEKAVQNNGLDEPSLLGLAYAIHSPKTQAFIGIDKEGHYYMHLPASTLNPIGAGSSMSVLGEGSLKETWGANADINNSWDLATVGGVRWQLGSHNTGLNSRSIDIRTSGASYVFIGGEDDDGFAKVETCLGNASETVSGDKSISTSNLYVATTGYKEEKIGGVNTINVGADMSLNVAGFKGFSETVIKEKNSILGSRKTKITLGNDELLLVAGALNEVLTFGARTTTIATGSITNTIATGSIANTIATGSYGVTVGAGAITLTTAAGTVSVTGTAINITAAVAVSVNAPIVRLGVGAPLGGALTGLPGIPSMFDYVVGAPYAGSFKVGIA